MAECVRRATVADLPGVVALANRIFRDGRRRGAMDKEYPLLLRPANVQSLYVADVDGQITSHVGVCPFTMHIAGVDVPVGCVGAVGTDPAYRARGLASQALELAIRDARDRGLVLMPISGRRSLYLRNHALPYCRLHTLLVPRERLAEPAGRPFHPDDVAAIVALHEMEPIRYRWTPPIFAALRAAAEFAGGTTWVHEGLAGKLDGFAMVFPSGTTNAAQPGTMVLQEAAGPPRIVASLLAAALQQSGDPAIRIRLTTDRQDLISHFAPLAKESEAALLAGHTLRIINLPRLVELFAARLAPLRPRATETRLSLDALDLTLEDPAAVHHVLFTQAADWPDDVNLPRALAEKLRPALPIPLPDYGLCYT